MADSENILTEAQLLANRLRRTISGPMWHGDALTEVLKGISEREAAARPISHAHTIWELVLHITAWAEIARERLGGHTAVSPTDEEDWPSMPKARAALMWSDAVSRMNEAYGQLAHDVASLTADDLSTQISGKKHSAREMLYGVVEHGAYHGGQIALLKRAMRAT